MNDRFHKYFDHTLDLSKIFMEVGRIADMTQQQINLMYNTINTYGVAVVHHANTDKPLDELFALSPYFGKTVTHDRADGNGLVVIEEMTGYDEFVGASAGPHLMHTGGTFVPDPPRIVLLQCVRQSRVGGQTMVASGAKCFEHLQKTDPEGLKMLMDPQVFSIKRSATGAGKFGNTGFKGKAIFDDKKLGNGRVWMSFRFDGQIKLDLSPDAAHEPFDRLLRFMNRSENQIDFKLKPNQIIVCDNTSVVHARTAFQSGSGRLLNRLQLDGNRPELVAGFPLPAS